MVCDFVCMCLYVWDAPLCGIICSIKQMWQPAFGRHNLMNRHILKPLSIRQLSYGFHKKKTRGICPSGCLLKCFTHTQMHRLLLCLDESPLTKPCWGLSDVWNSTCPNTNLWLHPMEVFQISSPLIIGSCCMWYACCVVYECGCSFLAATAEQNLRYTSSSVF